MQFRFNTLACVPWTKACVWLQIETSSMALYWYPKNRVDFSRPSSSWSFIFNVNLPGASHGGKKGKNNVTKAILINSKTSSIRSDRRTGSPIKGYPHPPLILYHFLYKPGFSQIGNNSWKSLSAYWNLKNFEYEKPVLGYYKT